MDLCLGSYTRMLVVNATRLRDAGRFAPLALSVLLGSLMRQYNALQRLFDGGTEDQADFILKFMAREWWERWCGDAGKICKCLNVLMERHGPTDFLTFTTRGEWTVWTIYQSE